MTKEEQAAITALQKAAKIWPTSLWLYSASGTLCVMKKDRDGKRLMKGIGYDCKAVVETIKIENDGGDW